ncbi:MAG: hypothetical protein QXW70_02845 [Candidatus Anstonellales archaeon]
MLSDDISGSTIKAQIALETLILLGFILISVVPIAFLFFLEVNKRLDDLSLNQTYMSAERISQTAFEVYAAGKGSRKTISIHFPQNLLSFDIDERTNEIIFTVDYNGVGQEIIVKSEAKIKDWEGRELGRGLRTGRFLTGGIKKIIFEFDSRDNSVRIGHAN